MVNKIITLAMIRDEILEHFPELLWWDGFHKHEPFQSSRAYKHRQGMPNEIRIEFDGDDYDSNWKSINIVGVELDRLGYSFAIYYVEGGRSPHLHIYNMDELLTLNYEQRKLYRSEFLKKVCPKGAEPDFALCDEKHLCALEFVNHFKYKRPKELLHYFDNGRNMKIEFDIKINILLDNIKNKDSANKPKEQKELKFGDKLFMKSRDLIKESCEFEKIFDKYDIPYKGSLALCPFHADKDRSLSFSNKKAVFHCFGCKESGDVVTFLKKLKGQKKSG